MTDATFTGGSAYVDTDEGRFQLHVHTDDGQYLVVDIHAGALEFYENVRAEIGDYYAEANNARLAVAHGVPLRVYTKTVSVDDAIEAGYALDDPKSPGYHDRMVD